MGKARQLTPKKDDKQKKISSFFQKNANVPNKAQQNLFNTNNQQVKEKSGVIDHHSIDDDCAMIAGTPKGQKDLCARNRTFKQKSISEKESSSKNEVIIKETQTATRKIHGQDAMTCIPETQMPPPVCQNKIESYEDVEFTKTTPSKDGEEDLDSSIIPDTPDSDNSVLEKRKRPIKTGRSFLCSSSFLAKGHIGPGTFSGSKPKVAKHKSVQQKGRSLEEALKDPTLTGGANNWNSHDPSFNVLMSEMGVKLNGTPSIVQHKNIYVQETGNYSEHQPAIVNESNTVSSSSCKRSPVRGEGISPNPKRINRRPSGSSGNVSKCRKRLQISKPKENQETNLKLNALKELKNSKKAKSYTNDSKAKAVCDTNDNDEVLCDILSELTNEVKIDEKQEGTEVDIQQFQTQYLPAYKKSKRSCEHGIRNEERKNKLAELNGATNDLKQDDVDSGNLLSDIIDELAQSASSKSVIQPVKHKPKRSIGPEIYDSQMSDVLSLETKGQLKDDKELCNLEEDFKSLSPFKQEPYENISARKPRKETKFPAASKFNRYKVVSVERTRDNIKLGLKPIFAGSDEKMCSLHGFWADTHVKEGDIVHIVGHFDPNSNECVINDNKGLIVVNPDLLISGTTVVSTVQCMRRSVLNEKFKGYDGKNIYMLYGSIIHSFFQKVIQEKALDRSAMTIIADNIVKDVKYLHDMYGQGVDENAVIEEIGKYMPQVLSWAENYLSAPHNNQRQGRQTGDIEITGVADIEENVWSPRYGTKGKIDLTVEVKIHENSRVSDTKMMPLELKTGRPTYSVEHKGQVTLYSMMSGDRREDPGAGLLLYLKDASMKTVQADHANKRGLIQLRNELAYYLNRSIQCHAKPKSEGDTNVSSSCGGGGLPDPINNHRQCSKCPHLLNCAIYQRSIETRDKAVNPVMETLVPEMTNHLLDAHLKYFRHWVHLLHLEIGSGNSRSAVTADIWCKTAIERETAGECISGMVITGNPIQLDNGAFVNKFKRQTHLRLGSVHEVGLSRGDMVIVSAENKPLIALTQGTVQDFGDNNLSLALDRNLYEGGNHKDTVFRIDKYEGMSTFGINFTNLTKLMEDTPASSRIRSIIIDKKDPEFEKTLSKGKIENVKTIFKSLNKPQKSAVLRVLMCKDYVLIKGYPGTGKTSTIVALVQILAALGNSVLLCSYTHSAVDNVLLKLSKSNVDFVRLGRLERIHPDVRKFAAEKLTQNFTTVRELANFYQSKPIVATTCLGVTHPVFTRRTFDVCIVDEASQVLQPACLGPLFCSNKFVLVGDPKQLPPVVQSKTARELGMSESLFARLDDTGATFELNVQYRMNSAIMKLSNELVYSGALQCGTEVVASSTLNLPNKSPLMGAAEWLQKALSEDTGNEVIFLDTDSVVREHTAEESKSVQCEIEADVVLTLVQTAIKCGVGHDCMGVISPYRQQVRLIKHVFTENHLSQVEVNTVDQYQGRDKQVIIVSFVKSTVAKEGHTSEILKDVRRLNVAITRAKVKLILVGHAKTLRTYEPMQKLLPMLQHVKIPNGN